MSDGPVTDATGQSALRILRGNPDDAELAAVVAVLAAVGSTPPRETDDRPLAAGWKSYHRVLRRPLVPGRGAWRNHYRNR
ncbi:acyl-CoA carboxylase subunit epsilon [Aestuariimicrobium sp. T2.26MG-19.2B]|uniref:acyl-CoA carboxylase subunit epsilon n=1 Tax=Aestuariimicrobium sp. T2.26MG-19.2B TaxID=3040679 RepID=UPI00247790DF|nr:acyl-CoA carboxylase subunit epsilon [Aestuariimicrobium sp. T2.26MG-19.2B]CAI9407376.1 hypothetical protein AESSP_01809 [Aestuariimicrobium sp. T2.26MG-19.2B]